ncbi:flavin reductase family protein [Blastococcus tunisiensis]|uniref:NADH-FMN oxidoreductase RutF, flavin reductase (DIM6/NTAB) family n=1 Tax=Blastococcus tunisiensis TaxID=1798228 RepID=A0A1I2JL56_9ACTN|nr:flavin reductase family protein [Blastococcus sp. DSM 46838]SFF54613.1 NADH-FMN oxidoreductase RutF, flavin reductase (DIM6/NTAB) family [Blastococcus sp. DSM 46838]
MYRDVTAERFRHALSQFASGVTVITTGTVGTSTAAGCTVSAFSSLSLDPPLVLACIARGKYMHKQLAEAEHFAVNVLSDHQRDVAMTFARASEDRFAGVPVRAGHDGVPLLQGAVAHLECTRYAVHDGGDHDIVVGRVEQVEVTRGEPLVYAGGHFLDLGLESRQGADVPYEWLLSAPW